LFIFWVSELRTRLLFELELHNALTVSGLNDFKPTELINDPTFNTTYAKYVEVALAQACVNRCAVIHDDV